MVPYALLPQPIVLTLTKLQLHINKYADAKSLRQKTCPPFQSVLVDKIVPHT